MNLEPNLILVFQLNMSINPGCLINNCTLINGNEVTVVNVTVHDAPVQDDEQHWLWSVIGRPTVQAAITKPNDIAKIRWADIFDSSKKHFDKSISFETNPLYSGAVMLMNVSTILKRKLFALGISFDFFIIFVDY